MRLLLVLLVATALAAPPDPSRFRARTIAAEALAAPAAYARLQRLTDLVGARLAGSDADPRAVDWAISEFESIGITARREPLRVPVWVRGEESAAILSPIESPMVMLGLGGSVGTPPEGIEAPVVVVGSTEDLEALGREAVQGRIVLFDHPFVRTGDEMRDYGRAVTYRSRGASDAARLGAVAALIRSVGTAALRIAHTGSLNYADGVPKIPAAAVALEDAALLRRLADAGHIVRVRLSMSAHSLPDREGANVVAEIRGRERPDEVVLVGAHLDSWDVGTGAVDDGAGCAMVVETLRLIGAGPPPRRTVRAVLFANEENGLRGGRAYRDDHVLELRSHVAAIEADSGAGRAKGVAFRAGEGGEAMLRDLVSEALAPLGAAEVRSGGGGADIGVLAAHGVPVIGLWQDTTRYFDWHHTPADTLDKVDPDELQQAAAALATITWILADAPATLPRYVRPPRVLM